MSRQSVSNLGLQQPDAVAESSLEFEASLRKT